MCYYYSVDEVETCTGKESNAHTGTLLFLSHNLTVSISLLSVCLNLQHWGLPFIVAGGRSHKDLHNL